MSKFLDELVNEVQQLLGNKVVCAKKVIRKNNVSKDSIERKMKNLFLTLKKIY